MIDRKQVEALIEERINELNRGLFLVELSISSTNVITVEIDRSEGSVSVEDCMSISRNIEHNLDREKQDFELNVSSAGLDRPLRVLAQFQKNLGEQVKVKLLDGHKMEGLLKDVNNEKLVIENTRKERLEGKKKKVEITEQHELHFNQIKETKIVISFK